jgi:hypothetical protein
MEYIGKLYGKIGRRMIPLTLTSEDVDRMQLDLQSREREIEELREVVRSATVLIAAKGRHNTMLAYEGLRRALLPENR